VRLSLFRGFWYSFSGIVKKSKRKALGQHFLNNKDVLQRIVKVIDPQPEDVIIEIGAGKGALTFCLAKKEAKIIALEKDKTLIPYLKKQEFPNLTVLEEDVLRIKFKDLLQRKAGKIVGNLPYAISTPIMFKVLEEKEFITSCVFLLQKEVAQRVCAIPGTKKYAPLSILFQNDFEAYLHFRVPASFFSPPPRVESALLSLRKRPKPLSLIPYQEGFTKFLKGTFQNRRKKLSNNLKAFDIPPSRIKKAYLKCGIEENWRPEQVSLSRFVALYTYLFDNQSMP
jgi:16S rRNA (adenine1518-N6/adenine1519-N6)-dimethyltransferase